MSKITPIDTLTAQLDGFITAALNIHAVMKVVPHPYNAVADMSSKWAHDFANFSHGVLIREQGYRDTIQLQLDRIKELESQLEAEGTTKTTTNHQF